MKCIILAGGFAPSLYPLTENFPKAFLDVANKTIIDRLIDELEAVRKIDEYFVVTNAKYYRTFLNWTSERKENITIINDGADSEANRYGSVRDIKLAVDKCGITDDCIVSSADMLFDFSLMSFFFYIQKKQASCTLRYYEDNEIRLRKNTVANINVSDKIIKAVCKPAELDTYWVCPEFFFLKNEDLVRVGEALDSGIDGNSVGELTAWLSHNTDLYAMELPGKMFRITNEPSLKKARKEFSPFN